MFVAYISLQEQRNLAARAHRYGCIHRCGPAFRVMHNYYFSVGVCAWGTKGQESHFCRGGGPHYSFLCPKPPPCVTPADVLCSVCLTELPHGTSSTSSLRPGWPGSAVTAERLELSIFNGPEGQRWVTSRANLRLGATSQHLSTLHFGIELHWMFFVSDAFISIQGS